MKVAILTSRERCEKYSDFSMLPEGTELVYIGQEYTAKDVLEKAGDADCVLVDAVLPVTAEMIEGMPKLKMIHSEGVGFAAIDVEAAAKRGVYVCNNRAVNAPQVAEHTVLLMLAVLRRMMEGDAMVRAGRQMEAKTAFIYEGLGDLLEKKIGMIGFGAIGKELARRLLPFGCELYYYDPLRADAETEREYHVTYADLETLYRQSDIITLHVPVNESTMKMINRDSLAMMKPNAIVVNCARGAVVDSAALAEAICSGTIYGAGLDTMDPEPVPIDDPIIQMPEQYRYRVVMTPHIAGTTRSVFVNSYKNIWRNVSHIAAGEKPFNIVNGL